MSAEQDPKRLTPDDIRSALSRVVASDTFARSERSRSFITYLVETEQAGDVDRLKGFAIAVDVFGRSEDFDPASDSVVRVQAGRLRELLETYYASEGAADPVRISVPRGSYAPSYARQAVGVATAQGEPETVEPAEDDEPQAVALPVEQVGVEKTELPINPTTPMNPFVVSSIRKFWFALMAVLALLLVIVFLLFFDFRRPAQNVTNAPQTTVEEPIPALGIPTVAVIGSDASADGEAAMAALSTAISRFSEVSLRSGGQGAAGSADYEFRVSNNSGNQFRLEVVHTGNGDVLWTGKVSTADEAGRITALKGILTLVLPSDGLIYAHMVEQGTATPLMICQKQTQDFFRSQNTQNFTTAYDCHRRLVEEGKKHALISADLASLMIEELDDKYPIDDSFTVSDAIDEARNAVNLGPAKATAYRALARALHFAGDDTAALDSMKRAYELNPNNLNIVAAWGYALYFVGRYDEAVAVLRDAVTKTDRGLPWWHHTMFLSAIAANDDAAAVQAAVGLARETNSVYLGAQLIAAQLAEDERKRAALLKRLNQSKSSYAKNPQAYYDDHLPAAAAARAAAILRDAGYVKG